MCVCGKAFLTNVPPKLKDSDLITINEVSQGFCDVSIASVSETRINPNFGSMRLSDEDMINFVLGRRLQVTFPEDLSSLTIKKENLFLPPKFFDFVYENSRSLAMSSSVCHVHESQCPTEYEKNGFTDIVDCVEKMESLPITKVNAAGLDTVDSNSTGCRHLHSSMVVLSPEVHCPHLSFVPMEDVNNERKCSASSDYAHEDFFTEEDFVLFQRTAQVNNLDVVTFFNGSASKGTCSASTISTSSIWSISDALSDHIFCLRYLETQQATDDDGLITTYWIALMGFLAVYSVGGMFLLRRRALSGKSSAH